MYNSRMEAYEGEENYIFASYSHDDRDRVLPILDALSARGYRIWFDDGIIPGSEWPASIENHLTGSAAVIFFISPNAVASANCRRELTLSLDLRKPFIYILLEKTKLAEGMNLQLSGQYCINMSEMSEARLVNKICKVPDLDLCRIGYSKPDNAADLSSKKGTGSIGGPESAAAGAAGVSASAQRGKQAATILVALFLLIGGSLYLYDSLVPDGPGSSAPPSPQVGADVVSAVPDSESSDPDSPSFPDDTTSVKGEETLTPADVGGPVTIPVLESLQEPLDAAPILKNSYEFVLTASDMKVREFKQATAALAERLAVFADGEAYTFSIENETIHIKLPADLFHGYDPVAVMECYLSRPAELYLLDMASTASKLKYDYLRIDRSDIESVKVCLGTIEGIDPKEYGIEESSYPFIELVLSESFAQKNAARIDSWEDLCLAQDILDHDRWYWYQIFPQPDGRTYYILDDYFAENLIDTAVFNYSHSPLPDAFSVQYNSPVSWEDPETSSRAGAHQVAESELTENYVILDFSSIETDNVTGKWLDTELTMKKRLDAVGLPYALGTRVSEGNYHLLVKTDLSAIGPYLPQLSYVLVSRSSGTNQFLVHNLTSYYYSGGVTSSSGFQASVEADGDGCYALRFRPKYASFSSSVTFTEYAEAVCTPEDRDLLFCLNGFPLLTATADDISGDYEIWFRHLYGCGDDPVSEDKRWLLDLAAEVFNDSLNMSVSLNPYRLTYSDSDLASSLSSENPYRIDEEKTISAIREAVPSSTVTIGDVYVGDGAVIKVFLNLNVDEDMGAAAIEQIKAVYNAVGLAESRFSGIVFYFADEDNTTLERARLFLKKDFRGNTVYYSYTFENGRMDKYKERFRSALSEDLFFSETIAPKY